MREQLQKARLYAICDLGYVSPDQAPTVARLLLEGGAEVLQLRAKGHDPWGLVSLSRELKDLCAGFLVPFIVNDHLDLAVEAGADGLHLGQDDGSLARAREFLVANLILGRSTHSLPQARAALEEGADYIGFGPLYPTPTKEGRPAIGLDDIRAMEKEVGSKIPAFCIGGIKPENLAAVHGAGARRFVVVSHLLTAGDPCVTTSKLLNQITTP